MTHPPTDPTGRSFLSYRHERMGEARLLIAGQRELGIPTWQDVDDLDEEPLEDTLEDVLRRPQVANAVLYLTPDVASSTFIPRIEAPAIVTRWREDERFFVVPVAAGGLTAEQAAKLVGHHLGAEHLTTWKFHVTNEEQLSPEGALRIAGRVLERRLATVHAALPDGEPMRLHLVNRGDISYESGRALTIDWTRRFRGRFAREGAWSDLLPRLLRIRKALAKCAPGREIEFSGSCSNSTALALGRTWLARGPFRCRWLQLAQDRPPQVWRLGETREPVALQVNRRAGDPAAEDLAVLLSVAEDVEIAFGRSKPHLPAFRAILKISPPRSPEGRFQPLSIDTPAQAADLVAQTVEAIREARREVTAVRSLHLFAAIPVGVAFLLGQSLNTLGPVQAYEVTEPHSVGVYRPELLLRPEDVD